MNNILPAHSNHSWVMYHSSNGHIDHNIIEVCLEKNEHSHINNWHGN